MDNNSDGLTNPTRLMCCSSSSKLVHLLLLTISNNKTPKLKTSDFLKIRHALHIQGTCNHWICTLKHSSHLSTKQWCYYLKKLKFNKTLTMSQPPFLFWLELHCPQIFQPYQNPIFLDSVLDLTRCYLPLDLYE